MAPQQKNADIVFINDNNINENKQEIPTQTLNSNDKCGIDQKDISDVEKDNFTLLHGSELNLIELCVPDNEKIKYNNIFEKIKKKNYPISLCADAWRIIGTYLRLSDQIKIIRAGIYIDIYEISKKNCTCGHLFNLTNKILSQPIFLNVEKLDLTHSLEVTDIGYLKNVKKLIINHNITDEQINKFNLISLNVSKNQNIQRINQPNLKKLKIFLNNFKIDFLAMPKIINLFLGDDGKFYDNDSIKHLNLKKLTLYDTYNITNLNSQTEITKLKLNCTNIIDGGINKLTNLRYLDIQYNKEIIKDITSFKKLELIRCRYFFDKINYLPEQKLKVIERKDFKNDPVITNIIGIAA